ncbi:IPT/TIG domain-containing protein [Brevibacillus thermoruber]|uniref:IPT/TIG domain-containing protein n=1 Tax=Brevibacillus thermoruber TaxID=33942 RepID=UPI0009DFBC4A|nr:IPT/TIG domain-containing protein [Brevibacillus thermoruber]
MNKAYQLLLSKLSTLFVLLLVFLLSGVTIHQVEAETVAPSITKLTPTSGKLEGGEAIYIDGKDFAQGLKVYMGDKEAKIITYYGTGRVKVQAPPGDAPGTVDVKVVNPDGKEAVLANAYTYQAPPELIPGITKINPTSGKLQGGEAIYIDGKDFAQGLKVYMGGKEAKLITYYGTDRVKVQAPPGDVPGTVDVKVVNPDGKEAVLANAYTYQAPPELGITKITPTSGKLEGGEAIYIDGENFVQGLKVYMGGKEAKLLTYYGATRVKVQAPAGDVPGTVDVKVVNPDGKEAVLANAYTYQAPPELIPGITKINPTSGKLEGGEAIYIDGKDFAQGLKVYMGGKEAKLLTYYGATRVKVQAPPGDVPGTVDVKVVNPDGKEAVLANAYTYQAPPELIPGITKITPTSGKLEGGEAIYIDGKDFAPGLKVYVGGKEANLVNYYGVNRVKVQAPPGDAPGTVDVKVVNPDGKEATLAAAYTYLDDPSPQLTSVTPSSGLLAEEKEVYLLGANLNPDVKVFFGDTQASILAYYTDGYLKVKAPVANTENTVDITVVNPDGQSYTLKSAFTYRSTPDPNDRVDTPADVGSVQITNVITPSGGGPINYGYGNKWRVDDFVPVTFEGTVADHSGNPLPNEKMTFRFLGHLNSAAVKQMEFITDANGRFAFQMILPAAIGEHVYSLPLATHYYDIVNIEFYEGIYDAAQPSSARKIENVSDRDVYHFSLSIYNP